MFDRIAGVYDLMNSVMTAGLHHRCRERAADLAEVGTGDSVLDVATGTGDLAVELARRVGSTGEVIGSDFSEQMLEQASALVAYRTYPHVDMAATGERAMRCLAQIRGNVVVRSMRQPPFLIPLTSQCTLIEPLASIFEAVAREEITSAYSLNFTPGFPAADVAECGPSIFGYGSEPARLAGAVERSFGRGDFREQQLGVVLGYVLYGAACMYSAHWFISWGNVLGLLPVMGQPMTWVTAGTSHIVFFAMFALTIALVSGWVLRGYLDEVKASAMPLKK